MTAIRINILLLACVILATSTARADVIRLQSSGQLRGKVTFEPTEDEAVYRITLVNGAQLEIDADQVTEFEKRPIKVEHYESKARKIADELDAHWELSEWCRENLLEDQRAVHLARVLDFDPKHRKARYGLGHTQKNGKWLTKEEYDQSRREEGYVKFNDKWVRAEQLASLQAKDSRSKAQLDWFRKVKLWLTWATGVSKRRADGLANLRTIRDPDSIPALIQFLGKSNHADTRKLFIDLIGRMGGELPVPALTTLGLRDDVRQLRSDAFNAITEDQHEFVQGLLLKELRDKSNLIVRRSGAALGRFGDEAAVPALIRALVTKHSYKARVPVEGYSYGTNGSFSGRNPTLPPEIIAGIRSGIYNNVQVIPLGPQGATKLVPFALEQQNAEVLAALKKLTKADFGFNEVAWTRWWKVERHQKVIAPDLQ
jgi:hypothetical protein